LRDVQLGGRPDELALIDDGDEIAKMAEVHVSVLEMLSF